MNLLEKHVIKELKAIYFFILLMLRFTEIYANVGRDVKKGDYWQNCADFDGLGWEILPPPNSKFCFITYQLKYYLVICLH